MLNGYFQAFAFLMTFARYMKRELLFILLVALCLSPLISPPIALLMGIAVAQFVGHPYMHLNHKATQFLLQASVVGLGFGIQLDSAIAAGQQGLLLTFCSIVGTLLVGILLGKWLGVEKKIAYLVSVGTAICGGSAIAAVSPVIQAKEKQISLALGTIFILNALALFIFPFVGHQLGLSQEAFGLWCAIAIHDTSSVVASASKYGEQALAIATTVKLLRALWIIPVTFLSMCLFKTKGLKVKIPWFIALFIVAMCANSYLPMVHRYSAYFNQAAHAGLTLTLFLIGCGLNHRFFKQVGLKPFLQGVLLWVLISIGSLVAILYFAA